MLQLAPHPHKVDADVGSAFAAAALRSAAERDPLFPAMRLRFLDDPKDASSGRPVRPLMSQRPPTNPHALKVGLSCAWQQTLSPVRGT